jgi:aspartyl-tRNA(Asn)/glutamyl-tRNA(Gln) amidotransferase subunit C
MKHFDSQTLEHLKKLCRIEYTPEEEASFIEAMPRILESLESLRQINTEGVQPCRFVLRGMLKTRVRQDVVQDVLSREQFLANAPDQIGGMIRTPPVL